VGRAIRKATAQSHKKLSLELGGKSPFIIFEDADLDSAVEGLVDGIWFNQGQVCCAGSRLLMQESIADKVDRQDSGPHEHAANRPALDKAIDMAPSSHACSWSVSSAGDQGVAEGATCGSLPFPYRRGAVFSGRC